MSKQHRRPIKKRSAVKSFYGPVATVFKSELTGSWRILQPVFNDEKCINCLKCQMFCPTDVITVNKDKKQRIVFKLEYCKGCGICMNVCPRNCIRMVKDEK